MAIFYSCGIPFFCALKVIIPCFISRKKVITPLVVSIGAFVINLTLNLLLMHSLKQGGIALATVVSSLFNNFTLLYLLHREGFDLQLGKLGMSLVKCVGAVAVAGVLIRLVLNWGACDLARSWVEQFLDLSLAGAGFVFIYILIAKIGKFSELNQFLSSFRKSGNR